MSGNFSKLNSKSEHLTEHSLAHELPYWDFSDESSTPWVSLSDGTLVMGLQLRGVSIETPEPENINRLTQSIRSFLNSLPDGSEVQFLVDVNSDFSSMISDHESLSGNHPLIKWVSSSCIARLRDELKSQLLRKMNLFLFIYERSESQTSAISSFFQKKKSFEQVRRSEHEKRLHSLNQKNISIMENLQTVGIQSNLLSVERLQELIYRFLNPKRSTQFSSPKINSEHRTQEFTANELSII